MNKFFKLGFTLLAAHIALLSFADLPVILPEHGAASSTTGSVDVRIEGVLSNIGIVYVSVFVSPQGFPNVLTSAHDNRSYPASPEAIAFNYPALPAGRFAISVFHDADGDKALSTNFLGIPKEAYGFSRNAKGLFGPPSFKHAAVQLAAGEVKTLVIQLH
jgi:uncharacterized protein (DUF2141 family)